MTDPIAVENITFAYDDQPVLRDVSMSVAEGGFLGLIGPNGSGKTTLMKIMLGLQSPDSGSVELLVNPRNAFVKVRNSPTSPSSQARLIHGCR